MPANATRRNVRKRGRATASHITSSIVRSRAIGSVGSPSPTTRRSEAAAGDVTIEYTNDGGLPHNVTLEGSGVDGEATETITEGSTELTVNLEPGEYTFYCSVDSHRDQGMEGTIVVN